MASTEDKKTEARLKREEAQARVEAAAKRNRNLQILAGIVFAAIVVVVLVVVVSGGKGDSKTPDTASNEVAGVQETKKLLTGLEQNSLTLGDPKAPVTIIEFIDMQCPFCKEHQLDQQPKIITSLVRTGKAKIRLQPIALSFMGEDSEAARVVLMRLAAKNKGWNYVNLFYFNQGQEQTGYVTQKFLEKIAVAAGGTTADASPRTASGDDQEKLRQIDQLSRDLSVQGTPTFAIGKTGQEPKDFKKLEITGNGSVADQIINEANDLNKAGA